MLGQETIMVDSGGESDGDSRQANTGAEPGGSVGVTRGWNRNWSQVGRSLLLPDEIMTLDQHTVITKPPGCPPILTTLQPYYLKKVKPKKRKILIFVMALVMFLVTSWAAVGL